MAQWADADPSCLHVVYRSTGAENRMSRPAFYSKLGCLKSLLAAAERCQSPIELIFVNDGPIPPRSDSS